MAGKILTVPISSIIVIPDLYPRERNMEERIEMFADIFRNNPNDVPPIIVAPLADEDKYILVDGNHRLAGASKVTFRIKVDVYTDLVVSDLDSEETKRELIARAALANWYHGQPLTYQEMKQVVRKLYLMHLQENVLSDRFRVNIATIYRWLGDIRRKDKENKKEQLKNLIDKGMSVSQAAEEVGLPKSTVSRLLTKKNADEKADRTEPADISVPFFAIAKNGTLEELDSNSLKNKDTEIQPIAKVATDKIAQAQNDGIVIWGSEVIEKFDEFYSFILGLNDWTKEVDDYLSHMLVPLLTAKSPAVRQIIERGYEDLWRIASEERDALQKNLVGVTRDLNAIRGENEALKKELHKKQLCSDDCSLSKKWVKEEYLRSLEGEVYNAVSFLEMLSDNENIPYSISDMTAQTLERIYTHIEWANAHFLFDQSDLNLIAPLYEVIENKNL
jgi:transposase-like protein